jgi:hypothetical protein
VDENHAVGPRRRRHRPSEPVQERVCAPRNWLHDRGACFDKLSMREVFHGIYRKRQPHAEPLEA